MGTTKLVRRIAAAAGVAAVGLASAGAALAADANGAKGPSPTASSSVSVDDAALRAEKMADAAKEGDSKTPPSPQPGASGAASGGILADQRAAGIVATSLGVSHDAAAAALTQLIPLSKGGLDPHSDGFRAVATGLGVTPEKLAQALDDLKRGLA
jgi:hypothetical protein